MHEAERRAQQRPFFFCARLSADRYRRVIHFRAEQRLLDDDRFDVGDADEAKYKRSIIGLFGRDRTESAKRPCSIASCCALIRGPDSGQPRGE
jgi:hypothetical protein